jgi:hypothetical protein
MRRIFPLSPYPLVPLSLLLLCLAAGPSVTVRKVDETTITGTLQGLEDGKVILSSPDARIPLEDLVELENKGGGTAGPAVAASPANLAIRKLTGKVIGLEGSWNDDGNTRDKAFDGDLDSFFDAPEGHMDDAWVGLDLGTPKVITQIKYAPRPGQDLFQRRMIGGRFQGSSSARFDKNVVDLGAVSEKPEVGKLTALNVSSTQAVRYVRYLTPGQGNGNVAEIEFWGRDAAPAGNNGGGNPATRRAAPATRRAAATPTTAPAGDGPPPPGTAIVTVRTAVVAPAPAGAPTGGGSVLVVQGDNGVVTVPLPAVGGTVKIAQAGVAGAAAAPPPPPTPPSTQTSPKPAATQATASQPATAAAAATTTATWRITLLNDDQLTGPLLDWSEKTARLAIPAIPAIVAGGQLDIPVESIREAWKGTPDQIKQAKALTLAPGPEDAAFVLNKDNALVNVRGVVLGITGDQLIFKFNDEQRKIALAKLIGVVLGGTEPSAKRDTTLRQTLVFSSGDILSGQWKSFDAAKNVLGIQTPWGASLSVPMSSITRIRSANGRLVYLSDLKPIAVEQTPYFDRMLPYQVNRALTGGPLKLTDGEYAKGIAVHSRTLLTYDIGGQFEEFRAKVGFQQPEGKLGQCAIRVLGDNGKILYEDPDARGDSPKPADLTLKITGVQHLTLEVDFGKNEDTGDRVVWANARVLRAKK